MAQNLFQQIRQRVSTLPQQIGAVGSLIRQAPIFQSRAAFEATQPVFRTPPGFSAPGFIGGRPAGQVLREQQQRQIVTAPTGDGQPQLQSQPQVPTQTTQVPQQLFEPRPQVIEPEIDISEDLRLAQQRADQASAELEAAQTRIETETGQARGQVQEAKAQSLAGIVRGKEVSQARAEEAISEQKRGFSEVERGLISRFGTGVSTGLGATAILGAQVLRSISQVRTGLNQQLADLDRTTQDVERQTLQKQFERDEEAKALKAEARAGFQKGLVQAQLLRGQAVRFKESAVNAARQRFINLSQEVESRNTAFKQKLELQRQQQLADIEQTKLKLRALSDRATTTAGAAIDRVLVDLVKSGATTPKGLEFAETQLGVPPGTLQTPPSKQKDPLDVYLESIGVKTLPQ